MTVAVVAAGPLYISAVGAAAIGDQLEEACQAESGLTVQYPGVLDVSDPARQAVTAAVDGRTVRRTQSVARVEVDRDSFRQFLFLISVPGQESTVTPPLDDLAVGTIAVSRTNAAVLGVEVGDSIDVAEGTGLVVAVIFDDVDTAPIPDFWCGWSAFIEPAADGDPPPPSGLVSNATMMTFEHVSIDEFGLGADDLTLGAVRGVAASFESATGVWESTQQSSWRQVGRPETELGTLIDRATQVDFTVRRLTLPAVFSTVVALAVMLVTSIVQLVGSRRGEYRLYARRGLSPGHLGARLLRSVIVLVAIVALAGWAVALVLVRMFGPSPFVGWHAIGLSGAAAASAVIVMMAAVVVVGGVTADRLVDRSRSRGSRMLLGLAALAFVAVAMAVLSFVRLDRQGGVRTYGVESRSNSLLALSFPVLTLFAAAVVAVAAIAAVIPGLRFTGSRLPLALRLGWRRLVADATTAASIFASVLVAAGFGVIAFMLYDGSRSGLQDKAEVYVGADLSVFVYDDVPANVLADVEAEQTSMAMTAGGSAGGERVSVLGIDPATFAATARFRADGSQLSLDDLVLSISDGEDASVRAVAVGSEFDVGDVVETHITGANEPTAVEIVALADFFPTYQPGAAMVVVDRQVVQKALPTARRVLLARQPGVGFVESLRSADVLVGPIKRVATVFDGSSYQALRWANVPLAAMGVVFAAMAMLLQTLTIERRLQERRRGFTMLQRIGYRPRGEWQAHFVDAAIPNLVGGFIGMAVGVNVAALALKRLDPMPHLPPVPVATVPWTLIGLAFLVWVIWSMLLAYLGVKMVVGAPAAAVMRSEN